MAHLQYLLFMYLSKFYITFDERGKANSFVFAAHCKTFDMRQSDRNDQMTQILCEERILLLQIDLN